MAWIGVFLGTFAGLACSILGVLFWNLPLWAALLLYPVTGSAIAVSVVVLFLLREAQSPAAEPMASGRTVNG
ncbi:hypothetical protein KBY27_09605 [Ruegeria pomeroyi]|uniref:Uncharacterized protein n=1 Tax=Ruegeria pomeroyi TaxID=89184 RepID=A0A9Q3WLP7_9RHOB|nr:hypothetical protein [Ruegeria pomeroyi]MCE8537712.1 hypothetical protein [Ruegeria pomeroyi]